MAYGRQVPAELPRVMDAPTVSRLLYDKANQIIGSSRSQLKENFLWLEEVMEEAIKAFSKPDDVSLLPKTPSMKNKRKASRNKGKGRSDGGSIETSPAEATLQEEDEEQENVEPSKRRSTRSNRCRSSRSSRNSGNSEAIELPLPLRKGTKKTGKKQSKVQIIDDLPTLNPVATIDKEQEPVAKTVETPSKTIETPSKITPLKTPTQPKPICDANSGVKEKINAFEKASSSSEEDGLLSKPKDSRLEAKRLTSVAAAATASPDRVATTAALNFSTPEKTLEPRLNLLSVVQAEEDAVDVETSAPKPTSSEPGIRVEENTATEEGTAPVGSEHQHGVPGEQTTEGDARINAEDAEIEAEVDCENTEEEVEPPKAARRTQSGRLSLRNHVRRSKVPSSRRSSVSLAKSVRKSGVRKSKSARDKRASDIMKHAQMLANLSDDDVDSDYDSKRSRSDTPMQEGKTDEEDGGQDEGRHSVPGPSTTIQEEIGEDEGMGQEENGEWDTEEENKGSPSPPVRMTRTKTRKIEEEKEEEEVEEDTPPVRCTRSKMRKKSGKATDPPGVKADIDVSPPAPRTASKANIVTPVHRAATSKNIRNLQNKLLSSSRTGAAQRTVKLTSETPNMLRIPPHAKFTTPTSANTSSRFLSVIGTGGKLVTGLSSFLPKKTTPNKVISAADELRLREAKLKEKETKEKERQQRMREERDAEMEERRRKNKERQEKAELMRQEREKIEAAARMKQAKTKDAMMSLFDKKKADKDKEERDKKKELLKKAELAEMKRKEDEVRRMMRQQQAVAQEKHKDEEQRRRIDEQEKDRHKKMEEQRKQEEEKKLEKQKEIRSELEKTRRLAEEKEKDRQRILEARKKEVERERLERNKQEMERLRQKQAEQEKQVAAERELARLRKAEEEARARVEKEKQMAAARVAEKAAPASASCASSATTALNSTYCKDAPASTSGLNSTDVQDAAAADESLSSYDMTPKRIPTPSNSENYIVDDLRSDDSTDEEDNPRKKVPAWAEKQQLRAALVKQAYNPPNLAALFGVVENPDLSQIFTKTQKKKYNRRGSSGIWDSPIEPPGDYHYQS